ncbi:gamma-glutamylcyclotransferase [Desulfovibrio mangrovi]|uniref:gamma-glutamylcyclotransferase family protein n=1 Tax=Desulfovibrio mangrovi TaxID=2976983 RepID=UPI0022460178|nr:gamma-glutamylcyclotransferase family protein [Desulfovibrio mangrovi]UZP68501.1 gamma-glutamylcyclotransferase [Desulfovibrio mangrovi]
MSSPFRLFVYGTLKLGGDNHDRYCRDAVAITPALLKGRIVERPEGYPTLFVPPDLIMAYGSTAYEMDADLCGSSVPSHMSPPQYLKPCLPWGHVFGHVLLFHKARPYMEHLDMLEDFFLDRPCMYERVLVPVWSIGDLLSCWTYISPHTHRFASEHRS